MRKTDTQELIAKLSQEVSSKTALRSPAWFGTRLTAVLAIYGIGVQFFLHIRPDITIQLGRLTYTLEITLLTALFLFSAVAAVLSMYPDLYQKSYILRVPYILFALLLGSILFQLVAMPHDPRMVISPPVRHGMECTLCIASLALIPSALIFALLKKGASVTPLHAGFFAILTTTGMSCLMLRLAEANDSLIHLLTWHYLPTLIFAIIGAIIGKFLLRW